MRAVHNAGVLFSLVFFMIGTLQAATVHWTGGSASNDWNDAANWSSATVPGFSEADDVLFVDAGDSTTLVTAFSFKNASSIKLRGDPSVTLSADLAGVSELYLGGNANLNGGFIHQTAGKLSLVSLRIGSLETATSESVYTLTGGRILNSGNLYVNKGMFLLKGNSAMVSTVSLSVTDIGTLAFTLDSNGVQAIEVKNRFDISEKARLIVDASALETGEGVFELVKFSNLFQEFNPENITITGLKSGLIGTIAYEKNRMMLMIEQGQSGLGLLTY
ncbi:hypothetical protein P4E94_02775 [Pontiellaceae bacterium B12219]|nr:hypothetical protein [Pontiellaceae bacterium B12219]